MNSGTYRLLQLQKENIHTNVPETRKKIKEGMIKLMHLILTIPTEQLTEKEIEFATFLAKSRTLQEVLEKRKADLDGSPQARYCGSKEVKNVGKR